MDLFDWIVLIIILHVCSLSRDDIKVVIKENIKQECLIDHTR
jgi:hypothetical protein